MVNQMNLPVFPDDHKEFKKLAAERGISMKEFFHKIVLKLPKWPVVKHTKKEGDAE